ncbi:MAG TPA: endonuclease/exonuclease/phosphatase family protein [Planctomycetota bacterium]|nr:endonuclease/exonuclease/phosphatase family protein [Planctomycetota bacterium]
MMPAGTSQTLRVATFNVHSCVGTDRRHDPARTSEVVAELDADIVALQEFRYPADIAIETRAPVVLTALEDYQCALGPTTTRDRQCYGNVLLTRHPIRAVRRIDLSHRRREPRGALLATLDVRGLALHVIATHLGLRLAERRLQVRRIVELVDELQSAFTVILGDFNDWLPGRSLVHVLDQRLGSGPPPRSFPVGFPLLALDRIWVQPRAALRTLGVHVTPRSRVASDHLPVVAELDAPLPPAAALAEHPRTERITP